MSEYDTVGGISVAQASEMLACELDGGIRVGTSAGRKLQVSRVADRLELSLEPRRPFRAGSR